MSRTVENYKERLASMIQKVKRKKKDFIFGHIEGISVGQIFSSRKELGDAGVHTPTMSGIWGREEEGSCSIVLSGGYEDDIDRLDFILYTGQGGQDVPGGKQVKDQEFTRGNKGLVLSKEYELPVRVTRGFQVEYGPDSGYRYDGIYYVTGCERIKGKSGFYVCRFNLESEKPLKQIEADLRESLPADYDSPGRTEVTIKKLKRNIKLSENIKKMYECKCQVCDVYLETPSGAIAIGAHIKALGEPHSGPDAIENMLCLCPNHHDQFDALSFYIESSNMEIIGLKSFQNKKLFCHPKHNIDINFLEYHKERYKKTVLET